MDIGENLRDAFNFAKDGLIGQWVRWFILIICVFLFPLMAGYAVRVLKGSTTAPDTDDIIGMLIDGIKLLIIKFVYLLIPLVILLFTGGFSAILAIFSGEKALAIVSLIGSILLFFILAFIFALFAVMGAVRFARTGCMGEAFNFSAILGGIGRIGWGWYIIALFIIWIVVGVIEVVLMIIPVIGWIAFIFVEPFIAIMLARYISLIYDESEQ